ncbi:hypothetical protein ACQRAC_02980 [Lactobacillus johnsonii]|uniref:hypothetical protein n=1 Tax=Lactobacillus johnsonii TaxID=33959 RepID=UPI003D03C89D
MRKVYRTFKNWLYLPDGRQAEPFNLLLFSILALSTIVAVVSFTRTLALFLSLI